MNNNKLDQNSDNQKVISLYSQEEKAVPSWITDQMIQSFSRLVKNPTTTTVRSFVHAVKTFEMWDETGTFNP